MPEENKSNQETITFQELKKKLKGNIAFDKWFEINKHRIDPNHTLMVGSGNTNEIINAKYALKKNQKEFNDYIKEEKLYGLTKAIKKYKEAIKAIDTTTKRESLIEHFHITLKEINLNKETCEKNYQSLKANVNNIIEPEVFWNEVERVEYLMKEIEIMIDILQHSELEDLDVLLKTKLKGVIQDVSTPENSFELDLEEPIINIETLSKYLGPKWSVSKIQKGKWKEIPEYCWVNKPTIGKNRDYSFYTEKIITWCKGDKAEANKVQPEKTELNDDKNKNDEQEYLFSFSIPIRYITSVLIKENYLNQLNAEIFSKRFIKSFFYNNLPKIEWNNKELLSLTTFILTLKKAGLINDMATTLRYNSEIGESNVPLDPFVNNFNRKKKGWESEASISRNSIPVKYALDAIEDIVKKQIKKEVPFETALGIFLNNKLTLPDKFKKNDNTNIKIKIDMKMLSLINEIITSTIDIR